MFNGMASDMMSNIMPDQNTDMGMEQSRMMMQGPGMGYNHDIKNMEMRIANLEREVNRLKHKVSKMDNGYPAAYNNDNNYGTSYQASGYNMM